MTTRACMVSLAAATAALLAGPSAAQAPAEYPTRAVRIVVPFSAGGGLDTMTRSMADQMRTLSGQPFVVDNKTGASGLIAVQTVLGSPRDGYDLLAAPAGVMVVAPQVRKSPVNPMAAFQPVCQFSAAAGYLFVGPHVKAKTFNEFVELARANADKLSYGSAGVGTQVHVTAELVHKRLGIRLLHVPYRGAADLIPDLISGRLDVSYDPTLVRMAKEGKVRVLAHFGPQRSADFPDVPTIAELGQPEVPLAWFGLFAPQGTPKAVVDRLARLCEQATTDKGVVERMRALTFWPAYLGPKAFGEVLQRDHRVFGDIIRELRIQGE